jgi:lipopolysaccharide transport system ATP-binding protein
VAHIGAFDLASYGDQLYPLVAAAELGRRLDGVEVLPFSPLGSSPAGPDGPAGASSWALGHWSDERAARLAARSSVVLCGGGEIVTGDGTSYAPFYDIDRRDAADLGIDRWYIETLGAAEATCPVVWHAPGVPAELDPATAQRVRTALADRAVVAVRDERSRQLLEQAGVEREIAVAPDSALVMDRVLAPDALAATRDRMRADGRLPPDGPTLVVQGNHTMSPLAEDLAKALDELAPDLQIVTVSVSPCHRDELFAEALRGHSGRKSWDVPPTSSLEDVAAAIAGATVYLGVSLHGAITAITYRRPTVTYDPFRQAKLAGFVELAGIPGSRTSDPVEAARLVAQAAAGEAPVTRIQALQGQVDAHFDRVAELVERSDRRVEPAGWDDTAAPLHLSLRRLPRPVVPAPTTSPPALRRPDLTPTADELVASVEQALSVRQARREAEENELDELVSLRSQNGDLRGAVAHLEGVKAKAEIAETELQAQVDELRAERDDYVEMIRQARAGLLYRLTRLPRALSLRDRDALPD